MELQGRVVKLLPLKEGVSQSTGNPYRTQDFIFGYYENPSDIYERNIVLNVRNDNIDKYKLAENDKIKVRIALGCREYPQGSGKYFNDIRTGDITIVQKADGSGANVTQQSTQQAQGQQVLGGPQTPPYNPNPIVSSPQNEGGDDLPF